MTRLIIQGIFLVMTVAIMDVKATPLSFLNSRGGGGNIDSKITLIHYIINF